LEVIYFGQILLSAVFLWKGAGLLVESSIRVARSLDISPLVIGLTVVALGTSAPEFAVTINAALSGQADISVSNVIGSNIFNLGFILGGVAIVRGIKTDRKLVWRDGMVLVASTIAILYFIWDLHFSRGEGIIMFAGLVVYLFYLFTKKERDKPVTEISRARPMDYLYLPGGIAMVVLGGHLLKTGAINLARDFGVSEWGIGITIVAAGTSAPEFVTSLVAAFKGQHGISAGNLIGSDLFNLLGVLGLAGILNPMSVTAYAHGSLVMLVGMVILVVIFMRTGWRLSRTEGLILVGLNVLRWTMKFT